MFQYPIKNNIVLFQKGPLSQWYGGFKDQEDGQFHMIFDGMMQNGGYVYGSKKDFNCAEQAMMWRKAILSADFAMADRILATSNPKYQRDLGRIIKNFDPIAWNKEKFQIIVDINVAKFSQNPTIKKFLCEDLKNYILAEAAPWDKIWGIGLGPDDEKAWNVETWQGENLLGRALMVVREKLR